MHIFRDKQHSVEECATDLIGRLTLAEKAGLLVMKNSAIERLGIGSYHWWSEGLHGYARAGVATVFPQAIGLAAAWSPELAQTVGDITATEGRAKNNEEMAAHNGNSRSCFGTTIWSPNINIFRDPRWGRGQETYGEDPFLTAMLGNQFVKGLQGNDPAYLKTVGWLVSSVCMTLSPAKPARLRLLSRSAGWPCGTIRRRNGLWPRESCPLRPAPHPITCRSAAA